MKGVRKQLLQLCENSGKSFTDEDFKYWYRKFYVPYAHQFYFALKIHELL